VGIAAAGGLLGGQLARVWRLAEAVGGGFTAPLPGWATGLGGAVSAVAVWQVWVWGAATLSGRPRDACARRLAWPYLLAAPVLGAPFLPPLPLAAAQHWLVRFSPATFAGRTELITPEVCALVQQLYLFGFLVVTILAAQVALLFRWLLVAPSEALPSQWRAARALFSLVLAVYLPLNLWTGLAQSLTGDEPHYLLITHSLLQDGDIELSNDYREGYRAFYPSDLLRQALGIGHPLDAHDTRGRHGEVFPVHDLGLSLLLWPAYAMAGRAGVMAFLALLAALVVANVLLLTAALVDHRRAAILAGLCTAFLSPLLYYSGQVMTEVMGALGFLYVARWVLGAGDRPSEAGPSSPILLFPVDEGFTWFRVTLVAGWLAFLPWVHTKFLPLTLVFLGLVLYRWRDRGSWWVGGIWLVSMLGLSGFNHWAYGSPWPDAPERAAAGRYPHLLSGHPLVGGPGLWWDQQEGLFPAAPIFLLVGPGLAWAWFKRRRDLLLLLGLFAVQFGLIAPYQGWGGGYTPPVHQLLPVLGLLGPFLALGLAVEETLNRRRRWPWLAGITGGLVYLLSLLPRLRYPLCEEPSARVLNPLFALLSEVTRVDWSRVVPSFGPATRWSYVLTLVYLVGLTVVSVRWARLAVASEEHDP